MDIAVIVPTRGRPRNARRLVNYFYDKLAQAGHTHLIFGVDDDDPFKDEYLQLRLGGVNVVVGPRLRMAGTLNAIARDVCNDYDILGFMGDDHLPRTKGWDDMVRKNMVPGGVLYGNDLIQGPNLPTEVFLDARIVRTLGGFVPDGFTHLFLDNTWKIWGEQTGKLIYLDNMVIEHMHPLVGKSESDDGYTEVNSPEVWGADEKRYNEYVHDGELDADIELLRSIS